ncbi:MAG: RDD family protein [Candidatus Thorarchaeota archaeon]|nr:RDD family protein [Candidatus Thorarchaeota archaeon]
MDIRSRKNLTKIKAKQEVGETDQKWNSYENKLASISRRAVAQIIDFTILATIFILVTYIVKGVWLMLPGDHLWIIFDPICGVFLVTIFAYFIGMEGLLGFTLGKLATGIRVVSEQGTRITMQQSAKRNFGRLVDGIAVYIIGIRIVRKSPLFQRYGDKIAQTVVIQHYR